YEYDSNHRIVSITDPNDGTTQYTYDPVGNLVTKAFPNGVVDSMVYDAMNRLVRTTTRDPNGAILQDIHIDHDRLGNVIGKTYSSGRIDHFLYDANQRLVREAIDDPVLGERSVEYVYDAAGNRIKRVDSVSGTSVYTYDADDRLLQISGAENQTFGYDANGNLLSVVSSGGDHTEYGWDSRNRLVQADVTKSDQTTSVRYVYDDAGNRVARIADGQEARFLIDPARQLAQPLEEYSSTGELQVRYTYGDAVIGQIRDGEAGYYHIDQVGTVLGVSDSTGALVNEYAFDAFGELLSETESQENRIRFTGEYTDNTTGLVYLRARHMDPRLARFLSTDPADGDPNDPFSYHRYVYAKNSPEMFTDPTGKVSLVEVAFATALVGTLFSLTQGVIGQAYNSVRETVDWSGRMFTGTVDPTLGGDKILSGGFFGSAFGGQVNVFETENGPLFDGPGSPPYSNHVKG
ncbi:MAG: hypothetical protein D6800_03485, partial [Candidatus Zixiibacteriota bacterium]